eukprot:snap_masked-scaffold_17-processed-gene-2.37-mRNA-1 protein AED:1.00 eAED:1.00 QI:0/0/0/0/1/1/2/0/245
MIEQLILVFIFLIARLGTFWFKSKKSIEELCKLQMLHTPSSASSTSTFLLVISHPDDETMFFSPFLFTLQNFYVICLSHGSAGREIELKNALLNNYSFKNTDEVEQRLKVLNSPSLQDGKAEKWDPEVICNEVRQFIKDKSLENVVVVSFDGDGISGHPNHKRTSLGCELLFAKEKKVNLMQLKTVGLFEKFGWWMYLSVDKLKYKKEGEEMYFNIFSEFTYKAMESHSSQFTWSSFVDFDLVAC